MMRWRTTLILASMSVVAAKGPGAPAAQQAVVRTGEAVRESNDRQDRPAQAAAALRPNHRESRPAIALTFDDIPAHGPLPAGMTRVDVIRVLVRALGAANAPAFGFFNGGFGTDDPAGSAKAVAAWRSAGLPLGNHSYSHTNLDDIGAAAFSADIARNEAPLGTAVQAAGRGAAPEAAQGSDWHWFRYPFLAEGKTPATREAARASLRAKGYRVAAVTMSFDDYKWNPPFAGCDIGRDADAVRRLDDSFLADARAAAIASRARAKAQLGRDIPYVLLLHVGAFDARMMPRLLALYQAMGFRFVTLAEAEADPYYAAALDLSRPGPTPSLAGPPRSLRSLGHPP
ncbi:polysaccharide deacetylase family protein [Sphingomonas sp. LR59]|uniref:polysaccharide deacetylase family protein n=1 Tax=Sphingomonas sp. LR59 TaxID=3050232 RepID=UPI002FE13F9C